MIDYKSNSFKSKETKSAVSSPVSIKKKTLGERVSDEIISDSASNVKNYIIKDVIVPLIKKGINDGVTGAVRMILYGDTKVDSMRRSPSASSHVSYRRYYDDTPIKRSTRPRCIANTDIVIENFNEAKEVLEELKEYLAADGVVSIARFYEITDAYRQGVVERDYMHNSFGWSSLSSADILPYGDRWIIKLPRPLPID